MEIIEWLKGLCEEEEPRKNTVICPACGKPMKFTGHHGAYSQENAIYFGEGWYCPECDINLTGYDTTEFSSENIDEFCDYYKEHGEFTDDGYFKRLKKKVPVSEYRESDELQDHRDKSEVTPQDTPGLFSGLF